MPLELSILLCKDLCLDNRHGLVQLLSGNSDFLVLSIISTFVEINLGFISIGIILNVGFFTGS